MPDRPTTRRWRLDRLPRARVPDDPGQPVPCQRCHLPLPRSAYMVHESEALTDRNGEDYTGRLVGLCRLCRDDLRPPAPATCPECGAPMPPGRRGDALTCSGRCRARRRRRLDREGEVPEVRLDYWPTPRTDAEVLARLVVLLDELRELAAGDDALAAYIQQHLVALYREQQQQVHGSE